MNKKFNPNDYYSSHYTIDNLYSLLIDNILHGNKTIQGQIIYKKLIQRHSRYNNVFNQNYYKQLIFNDKYCVLGFMNTYYKDGCKYYNSGIRHNIVDIYHDEIKSVDNIVSIKLYIDNVLYRI